MATLYDHMYELRGSINCDDCLNKITSIILRFSSYRTVNPLLVYGISQLMLYREIIAVCSEIYT
jgi:hypothetical protein